LPPPDRESGRDVGKSGHAEHQSGPQPKGTSSSGPNSGKGTYREQPTRVSSSVDSLA
jgi:hypothetical protein